MTKLTSIIKYICNNYPHTSELSNARLTKMVYLADWNKTKLSGKQLTNIEWYFNNYGPYVDDIINAARKDPEINVISTTTTYGTPKVQIACVEGVKADDVSDEDKQLLDSVFKDTEKLFWNDFIKYVYNTFPIKNNPKHSYLDLVSLAEEEKSHCKSS